ncbi:MAG: gamma-glutamyltransferase [Saprospiraceae bacterium]|nr:gamma-glutamyltransferase [Saprospiraceae bacterium]
MKLIRSYLLFGILFLGSMLHAQDRITGRSFATRSEVIAVHGMAATSQPLATQVALDILKAGGTAVDAAIAANATLGLMEPTGSGIGGDLFALIWDAESKQLYGLNASGRSPKGLTLDYFKEQGMSSIPAYGPLPVSIPGCVDGWFEMHDRFGKMPMDKVLGPAIQYALEGFPVSELIAMYMDLSSRRFKSYPNFADTYMPNGSTTPAKGEIFSNPALAATYEALASGGRDAFYDGAMTKVMVDFLNEQGGFFSLEDFSSHKSEWVQPISSNYRGYDIWELPPNGQGTAVLQILNILEAYDLNAMGFGSAEYIHTFVEAKKLAYEDRAKYYADPAFNELPIDALISKEYAEERRALINPNRAARRYDAGNLEQGNTIYMTVADQYGNMVSLIQSNYRGMGSGMVAPGLGFMFQDRGELFSLEEGHLNVYEPGKRPFHTIIPGFVTKDGNPWISFGVMGGGMQPQGHAQVLINMIDFGMNLQEAGDAPRVQHTGSSQPTGETMTDGGKLVLETGFDYEVIRELMKMGHQVGYDLGSYGGYQAILRDPKTGVYYGASESRKDGQAAGY